MFESRNIFSLDPGKMLPAPTDINKKKSWEMKAQAKLNSVYQFHKKYKGKPNYVLQGVKLFTQSHQ